MKHLFLLLLAANMGLFIWSYQREQAMEHAQPNLRADVGDLRLLSEQTLELEAIQEPEPAFVLKMEVDEPVGTEAEVEQQILPEDKEHEDLQAVQQTEDKLSQSGEQITQTRADKVRDVSLSDAGPAQEDHVVEKTNELQFEDSAGSDQAIEIEQRPETEITSESELETMQTACYRLGPILGLASAEGLSGRLMQFGFDAEIHKQSIKKIKGYWVATPPQVSYRDANQKLQELKKMGITDLWLYPGGEYKNAISLGLYSRIANAEVAQAQALKKGVVTAVLPRHVQADQYWLEFQNAELPPITEEFMVTLQEEYPDEKFAIQPCPTVVTQ